MPPSAWQNHLTKFRSAHPNLTLKQAMQEASKTYQKAHPSAPRMAPKGKAAAHSGIYRGARPHHVNLLTGQLDDKDSNEFTLSFDSEEEMKTAMTSFARTKLFENVAQNFDNRSVRIFVRSGKLDDKQLSWLTRDICARHHVPSKKKDSEQKRKRT